MPGSVARRLPRGRSEAIERRVSGEYQRGVPPPQTTPMDWDWLHLVGKHVHDILRPNQLPASLACEGLCHSYEYGGSLTVIRAAGATAIQELAHGSRGSCGGGSRCNCDGLENR